MKPLRSAEDVRQVLVEGLSRLGDLELSGSVRAVLPVLLRVLRSGRDDQDWAAAVGGVRTELHKLDQVLGALEAQLADIARLDPETDAGAWWAARRGAIESAGDAGRPADAVSQCVEDWTEALVAGALTICAEIAELARRLDPEMSGAMTAVVGAIGDADAPEPAGMQRLLAEASGPLSLATEVRLGMVRARLRLRSGAVEAALSAARDALERAQRHRPGPADALSQAARLLDPGPDSDPASPEESLAAAVLAEVNLAMGRLDEARTLANRAVTAVAPSADAFVSAGLVAEADAAWPVADEYYLKALDQGATGLSSPALRPAPARLKIADARRRRDENPDEAIALYESALTGDVPGESARGADLKVELAGLLRTVDPDRAAARYADAAGDYSAAGLHARAAQFYADAGRLRPGMPEYWWLRAEALRMQAVRAIGVADDDLLRRAREVLDRGLAIAAPSTPAQAWVLVTQALLDAPLEGPRPEQLVLLERSLLLADNYPTGYTFLVDQLRERGYVQEALAAAEQNHARNSWDSTTLRQLSQVRIEAGRYAEAVAAAAGQLWLEPGDTELLLCKALALMRQGRSGEALDALKGAENAPRVRLLRAYLYAQSPDYPAMTREFRRLSKTATASGDRAMAGWAAFHSGPPGSQPDLLTELIDTYTTLVGQAAPGTGERLGLGQMLLVRGDSASDDLDRGERLLREAVAASPSPDELLQLRTVEFDLVRRHVAGRPHEWPVADVLDALDGPIEDRRQELLSRVLDPGSLAGRLASARSALAGEAPADAFATYHDLWRHSGLPDGELLRGLARAGEALLDQGDRAITGGSVAEAQTVWARVHRGDDALPRLGDLGVRLHARRFLGWCALGRLDAARAELDTLLPADPDLGAVGPATRAFAEQPELVWAIYDSLTGLAEPTGRLDRIARDLPFAVAHRLGRDQLATRSAAPAVNALEIRLGAGCHDLLTSPWLNDGIAELRSRIADEMGIRIQGIRLSASDDAGIAGEAQFRLYEEEAGRLPVGVQEPGRLVLTTLERIVRERLYRLVSPDDIVLWLADWDADRSTPETGLTTAADRLAMARLLRLLLREGVPVRDRQAILDMFASCGSGADPHTVLRAVRLRLRTDLDVLNPPAQRVPMPAVLEDRISAGLSKDGGRWEATRAEARGIVDGLHAWLAEDPGGRRTVVVRDPVVRPYVWRLLAATRPPVRVVAEEELT